MIPKPKSLKKKKFQSNIAYEHKQSFLTIVSEYNPATLQEGLYIMTNWNISQEYRVSLTLKNHHINQKKRKYKTAFEKCQHLFMIIILSKLEVEVNFFHMIKGIFKNLLLGS